MPLPRELIEMLESTDSDDRVMPATKLYNEGWMLRLVLAVAKRDIVCLPFTFAPGARWFSEPQLYSAFHHRSRRDALGERTTSADGAVGHFAFTASTKTGLKLNSDATQFIILEAKMAAALSKRTKNAPGFDQAARTIACMAETLRRRGLDVDTMRSLGFYVVAPREQFDRIASHLDKSLIKQKILDRIEKYSKYEGVRRVNLDDFVPLFLEPLLRTVSIDCIAWEDIIHRIAIKDRELGADLAIFYDRTLHHNFSRRAPHQ